MIPFMVAACAAAPAAAPDVAGHWRIVWTRGGGWWPKDFTGPLVIREVHGTWVASVAFEQVGPGNAFQLTALNFVPNGAELVFTAGETTFDLRLRAMPNGDLEGEARMVGTIDWSPVRATREVPVPAVLPGAALTPVLEVLPTPVTALPPPEVYRQNRWGSLQLSEDGRTAWIMERQGDRYWVWKGLADGPATSFVKATRPVGWPEWWTPDPGHDGILLARRGGFMRVDPAGKPSVLAEGLGDIRWVEPRFDENSVVIAAGKDRLRVFAVPLDGSAYTEIWSHPTADDVVFDAAWKPRFLFERERKHFGKGVDADLVTVLDPDGGMLGTVVRQPTWVADSEPAPRVGNGPVHLLGGGDLATLGVLGKKGFVASPLPGQWGDAYAWTLDPDTGAVDAVAWIGARMEWRPLTRDGEELTWLTEKLGTDVRIGQRVADDRRWVVHTTSGSSRFQTWLFDRDARTVSEIAAPGSEDTATWASVEPVDLVARDGQKIALYVTRPAGTGPWPLVVDVHGGPWSGGQSWTFDPQAQQWADRGYATLAVNFRGTHGYGWQLMEATEFGSDEMIHDVEDGIQWAIDQGVADPTRIAMVGSSYGGYAALRFATAEKPILRCAVAGLVRGNLTTPGGGLNIDAVMDAAWREARSPDRFTSRITAPVLVWNGGRDGDNADAIQDFVQRAAADGKAVTWVRFPWEGHGLVNRANRTAIAVITDRFLGACLGGPSWDFGPDFAEAELEVRAGVDGVPGLAERVR